MDSQTKQALLVNSARFAQEKLTLEEFAGIDFSGVDYSVAGETDILTYRDKGLTIQGFGYSTGGYRTMILTKGVVHDSGVTEKWWTI